jgi:transcriptional regulator with XRE-family HTH domain
MQHLYVVGGMSYDRDMVNKPAPSRGPLRRLREARLLTQDDVARLADLDRSTIIRLEQDPTRAYAATLIKLAPIFDMDPRDLRDLIRQDVA